MNTRIESYVNELFANLPSERYVSEIKEELLSDLNEKYNDLCADGKSEEEAYQLVIAGIGDIRDLFSDETYSGYIAPDKLEKNRSTRSLFISVGTALYILSLVTLTLFSRTGSLILGLNLMILICAVATGFVVYGSVAGKPKFAKADNSFVENYKEKMVENERIVKLRKAISSSLWTMTVVVYLALSFVTNWWSVTWIVFLMTAFVQQFIFMLMAKGDRRRKSSYSVLWTGTVVAFFVISFAFNAWAWSWMIFLVAVSVQEVGRLIRLWRSIDE